MKTYKIKSITLSDESKMLSVLDKLKIKYDYRCNGTDSILFLEEEIHPKLLEYFENNPIELLKEGMKEVPDIKNAALEGIVNSLYEWISTDVSKEQIYSVIWALAMSKEDEAFNRAVLEIRNVINSQLSEEEIELPTLKPQQDEPGRLIAGKERDTKKDIFKEAVDIKTLKAGQELIAYDEKKKIIKLKFVKAENNIVFGELIDPFQLATQGYPPIPPKTVIPFNPIALTAKAQETPSSGPPAPPAQ